MRCVLINETRYSLNKLKSKHVELAREYEYEPYIKVMINKNDYVIFDEDGWNHFFKYNGVITDYFYSNDTTAVPTDSDGFAISFEELSFSRYQNF